MAQQLINLPMVGASNFGQYPKISNEKTFNLYISDEALVPFAGYQKVAELNSGGVGRAIFNSPRFNHLLAVVGDRLYAIDRGESVALLGTLETSNGNVFMTENNGTQIAITDRSKLYVYNWGANNFQTVNLPFRLEYIDFHDTYIIGAQSDTNRWQLSEPNNAAVWPNDEASVGLLQTRGDIVRATVRLGTQVLVMGNTVTDIFYNYGASSANAPFPYQRNNWYSIEYGCVNPATIAISDNMVVWLGANEKQGIAILVSSGQQAQQISTDGLNYLLTQLEAPTDAVGMLYKQAGHLFYQITWKTDNLTLVYDFNTKSFFHLSDHKGNHHIARSVAFFNNEYYFVSLNDGALYKTDPSFYDYDGNTIPRVRQLPNYSLPDNSPFTIDELGVYLEQGSSDYIGVKTHNEDQRIQVSISKDGSNLYGNIENRLANSEGNRQNRFHLFNLGLANEVSTRITFWGRNRFVVKGGYMRISQ